ncbi:MAG: hypothetical protein P4K83_07315 [Terracidiphilus sp.]|nr:hypothetical protein [Terracidiphilus sp.]
MPAPTRGTQLLVGHMNWVLRRPGLVVLEVGWKWAFGIPLLLVCQDQALHVQRLVLADPAAPGFIDFDNPWMAAQQLAGAWVIYKPYVQQVLDWLIPAAAMAWVVASGVGRSLLLSQMEPQLKMRAAALTALQALQAAALGLVLWGWYASLSWAAAANISTVGEPDLVGYSAWAIFLSLGFFVLWALVSWPLGVAPVLMFLEECSPWQALRRSFRLGKVFTGKLIEINLVMGIARLALVVLAMVFSAAPLPFSDQLGPQAMHVVWGAAAIFFLVACDFFQVMRLKSFVEFWWIFRG